MAREVDFSIGLSFELIFNSEPKKRKCSLSLHKKELNHLNSWGTNEFKMVHCAQLS